MKFSASGAGFLSTFLNSASSYVPPKHVCPLPWLTVCLLMVSGCSCMHQQAHIVRASRYPGSECARASSSCLRRRMLCTPYAAGLNGKRPSAASLHPTPAPCQRMRMLWPPPRFTASRRCHESRCAAGRAWERGTSGCGAA